MNSRPMPTAITHGARFALQRAVTVTALNSPRANAARQASAAVAAASRRAGSSPPSATKAKSQAQPGQAYVRLQSDKHLDDLSDEWPELTRSVSAAARSQARLASEQRADPGTVPGVQQVLMQQLAVARKDLLTRTQCALDLMAKACMDSLNHLESANSYLRRENDRLHAENERLHGQVGSGSGHTGGTGDEPTMPKASPAVPELQLREFKRGMSLGEEPTSKSTVLEEKLQHTGVVPPTSKRPPTPSCEEPPQMSLPGVVAEHNVSRTNVDNFREDRYDHSSEGSSKNNKTKTSLVSFNQRVSMFSNGEDDDISEKPSKASKKIRRKSLFADADKMKAKVREAVMKKEYDVRNLYNDHGIFQWIARSTVFENITLGVILFNALWISIDLDWNKEKFILDADWVFQAAEYTFTVYFTGELFIRFMAFRCKKDCLKDLWFLFDSLLVWVMVMETGVLTMVVVVSGNRALSPASWADPSILKVFRMLKITRMARMIRLLRATPELMILIKGMVIAMRSVVFTLFLLLLFIYLFAILFKSLLEDTTLGEDSFHSVPHAISTLLLQGALPDNAPLIYALADQNVWFGILCVAFVLMTTLTVMNMLVGVLVEVVGVVSTVEKEQMNVQFVYSKLQELLTTSGLDADGDMKISKAEFESLLLNPKAARMVQEVGVDVVGLVDFSEYLFQGEGTLSFPEFMELVLQLRGSNTATVKDIVDLRKFIASQVSEMAENVKTWQGKNDPNRDSVAADQIRVQPGRWPRNNSPDFSGFNDANSAYGAGSWAAPRPPSSSSSDRMEATELLQKLNAINLRDGHVEEEV